MPDAVGGVADIDHRQRILRDDFEPARPLRVAQAGSYRGLDPLRRLARLHALQPEQEQGDGDRGVVELHRAEQVRLERRGNRDRRTGNRIAALTRPRTSPSMPISSRTNSERDAAMAVIFEQMRPQVTAVLAVDDGAAGGAGVALVGYDQFQRIAEQFDMLVVDRGHAGLARADQADRIVAAADAGLEHDELAFVLLEMEAGQRKQRLEGAEAFAALC